MAGVFEGGGDEAFGGGEFFFGGRGRADEFLDVAFPEAVDEAVGAEDEAVAGREGDGAELGFDELVAGAEGLVEGVAHRVGAGFAFVDLALAAEVADVGVIVSELGDAAGLG